NSYSTTANPGQGSWGVYSTSPTFDQSGSLEVGGTDSNKVDHAPQVRDGDSVAILLNQTWPGGFPTTPDSAFGFNEGTLKVMAKSGFAGSQYVTDPTKLRYPLSGVTYVELPTSSPSNTWSPNTSIKGQGIFIIHNSARNATIKNANGS